MKQGVFEIIRYQVTEISMPAAKGMRTYGSTQAHVYVRVVIIDLDV